MEVLVVGAGTMGRWFAESIHASVAFTDVITAAAEDAAADLDRRAVPLDTDERFDVVCITVPMRVTKQAIADHAPRAREGIIDLSGSMAAPVAAMATHAPDRERVSFHPLFAPENAPGRIAVVSAEPGPFTDDIRAGLAEAGNELFETTPEAHDRAMETVQAKAHAALLAFALAADDVDPAFATPIYARLAELATEVSAGEPHVYADIQDTFPGADAVAAAATELAEADREAFEELYRDARR